MSLPQQHFIETKKLSHSLTTDTLSNWLLNYGYYPENYVLPPCFKVSNFQLNENLYFNVSGKKYEPVIDQPLTISFPKSLLTVRTYGIINPQIYHDLVFLVSRNWDSINSVLFNSDLKIYSYSYPIPVVKNKLNNLSDLRSGRLIYEFLEMAENDLVSEAYRYKYLIKTDISNFYPSVYTHSLTWAIHTKEVIRNNNRRNYDLYGNCIDKLIQNANDGCTNGLAIGSALSDLLSELLLASIDCKSSVDHKDIDFIAVRFKDDYRILCHSKEDANLVLHVLQQNLSEVNLVLNEKKTFVCDLPEGLYREWNTDYKKIFLKKKYFLSFKYFESVLLMVLEIDKKYPGTGVIDRFLSDITTKSGKIKIFLRKKERIKIISLLLLLKTKRPKIFPRILALVEQLYLFSYDSDLREFINNTFLELLSNKVSSQDEDEYELIWLLYFSRRILHDTNAYGPFSNSFIESVNRNKQMFYKEFNEADFFYDINDIEKPLYHYLKVF